ncbi:MAG TPA: DUF4126 domain-containing protein [Gemmatimonadaceae bacterium]|nr:DUF4126 domain-containing protein [Gemmatimonadaceae bacterium]
MESLRTLAQALGIAYAAGINLYAAVAVVGLAERLGWVGSLPGGLGVLGNTWVIVIAGLLYVFEFLATLVPGVASAWETFHSVIRPPAAAALAAATMWDGDPILVLVAALLGGAFAVTTHTTKLGLRYAIDTSPEPVTNGVANIGELALVSVVGIAIWHHPFLTLLFAALVLVALILIVRLIWRVLRQVFAGRWMPGRGLLQEPRATPRPAPPPIDEP